MIQVFSPMEAKILKVLGRKKMTISEITDRVYTADRPLSPANNVAKAISRINEKCDYHRLDWFVNGMGAGRAGKTVWKDKK